MTRVIYPLFKEVYYKAKMANPMISDDVRLFICDDTAPNAFATGRKTMCVTRGLLVMSDEEIKTKRIYQTSLYGLKLQKTTL